MSNTEIKIPGWVGFYVSNFISIHTKCDISSQANNCYILTGQHICDRWTTIVSFKFSYTKSLIKLENLFVIHCSPKPFALLVNNI